MIIVSTVNARALSVLTLLHNLDVAGQIINCISLEKERGGTMNVQPLGDRILVKRTEEEERTKGGIIIPDTAKEKPIQGKVIAVGKGKVSDEGKVIPLEVKAGDKVLFGKYAGTEVKIDGEEHLIMREDDVLGIIED
jgi:chaperonin GroES